MTTRQRIARQQQRQEALAFAKDILGGLIIGAGLLVIFFLS